MPYPITTDYTLDEGIDPTGLFGGYASVLLQMVREAVPNSYRGMIIVSPTTPSVVAPYEWHKRCLWIKPIVGTGMKIYVWDSITLNDWIDILSIGIPADSITTAMLQDDCVTLDKINTSAGFTYDIIQIDVSGDPVWIAPADAIQNDSLVPAKLAKPAGTDARFMYFDGTTVKWELIATIIAAATIPDHSVDATAKLIAGAASSYGRLLRTDAAGTTIAWEEASSSWWGDNTFAVAKLVHGTAYQALITNAAGTDAVWGAINLASSAAVTGILPVANGGTGTSVSANTACFRAVNTVNQEIPDGDTEDVSFDSQPNYTSADFVDPSYTVPITGVYKISGHIEILGLTPITGFEIYVYKGASVIFSYAGALAVAGTSAIDFNFPELLTATDVLKVQVHNDDGTYHLWVKASSSFSAFRV